MKALARGIRLPDHKYRSLLTTQIHTPPAPRFIVLPLKQEGSSLKPCVREEDPVFVGTKVAEGLDSSVAPIHSSVSGKVSKVEEDFIYIESDESDRLDSSIHPRSEIPSDPEHLTKLIREAGIIHLGGVPVSLDVRLNEVRARGIDTLVINGCESEPFLTADHMLMLNHPVEVLKGTELLRIASGAKRALIACERNKLEAIEVLNSKNYNLKLDTVQTLALPVRYPQGSERALAEAVRNRRLRPEETSMSAGVLVEHVAEAFAVYEAVYLKKPFFERVVTVGGPCVLESKNLWARFGTRAVDLIRSCKGFMRDPERVIFGGPMTGVAISDLETPVTKTVSGILALPSELIHGGEEEPCIRCGWCVEVCPEALVPEAIVRALRQGNVEMARDDDMDSCTECGCCAYICPSKIPIVELIRKEKPVSIIEYHRPEVVYEPLTKS